MVKDNSGADKTASTDARAEWAATSVSRKSARPICMKCKSKPAEVQVFRSSIANLPEAALFGKAQLLQVAARQREPLCRGCLCDGLVSKVKQARCSAVLVIFSLLLFWRCSYRFEGVSGAATA